MLWSDSRIIQALSDGGFDHDNWLIAKLTMEVIRDEYEAELAAVRGQLARCSELYDKRKGEMWQLEQDLDALAAEVERLRAEPRWEPVNPVGMVDGEYDDAEIKLCYRRLCQWQPAQDTQQQDGQEGGE